MSPAYGLVGLPNAGKSTLFNALTKAGAEIGSFPFTTINPNKGVALIQDPRVSRVAETLNSERTTYQTLEVIDIAGLVRGANRGEGLGNQFLAHIREVDAVIHVVRCFGDVKVGHVEGPVDPARDAEIVDTELALADIEFLERRMERAKKLVKGVPGSGEDIQVIGCLIEHLSRGRPARTAPIGRVGDDLERSLLTAKPALYVANVDELLASNDRGDPAIDRLRRYCSAQGATLVSTCARLELELTELDDETRREFMADLGLKESGLDVIISESLKILDLISFFTGNRKETRAWLVKNGIKARQAAGKIHTDMERGFIAAEVVPWRELVECGSLTAAREAGKVRLEGAGYQVADGDLIQFRFSPS